MSVKCLRPGHGCNTTLFPKQTFSDLYGQWDIDDMTSANDLDFLGDTRDQSQDAVLGIYDVGRPCPDGRPAV